jgi:hypothetical protein
MIEVPSARPVHRVLHAPSVAHERLERSPNPRLGVSADPASCGQAQRVPARQRQDARQQREHEAQLRLLSGCRQNRRDQRPRRSGSA